MFGYLDVCRAIEEEVSILGGYIKGHCEEAKQVHMNVSNSEGYRQRAV
jgi:hypothetical protein